MSASFENPDQLVLEHGLSQQQLWMAQMVEEASLAYVKGILERMGVKHLTRSDTWQTMGPKLAKHQISVAHLTGSLDESEDGWWIRQGQHARVHISHPVVESNNLLRFPTRYMS